MMRRRRFCCASVPLSKRKIPRYLQRQGLRSQSTHHAVHHASLAPMGRRHAPCRSPPCRTATRGPPAGDRSLGSLERSLLGIDRGEDIPGAEIPALYFRWLRERDPRLMEQVFRHNRYDILSLLSLGTTLTALLDHRRVSPAADPSDLLAASRLWASCGAFTKAIPLLEELCTTMAASSLRKLALRDLSLLYRRLGKMDQAVPLWE